MTANDFKREVAHAVKQYHLHVVCVKKTPDEFEVALESLLKKAIKAYETRPAGMRHGIALDKEVTVILSQGDMELPLCGIYFNLYSAYLVKRKKAWQDEQNQNTGHEKKSE